jgi:hypothetical protein
MSNSATFWLTTEFHVAGYNNIKQNTNDIYVLHSKPVLLYELWLFKWSIHFLGTLCIYKAAE